MCRLYSRLDDDIIKRSPIFQKMVDDVDIPSRTKKRKAVQESTSASETPVTRFCVDTSSDESDNGEDADDDDMDVE